MVTGKLESAVSRAAWEQDTTLESACKEYAAKVLSELSFVECLLA